jgi:hypothetical protein
MLEPTREQEQTLDELAYLWGSCRVELLREGEPLVVHGFGGDVVVKVADSGDVVEVDLARI